MNTTKLFTHPTIEGALILGTTQGNLEITDNYIARTTISTEGLTEVAFDTTVQGMVDNAKFNAKHILAENEITGLVILVNEKMEDFDGPEA